VSCTTAGCWFPSGRRQPAGLLPDGGQVAGRGRSGPGAWKGRVCLGATSEVAEPVAIARIGAEQGTPREDCANWHRRKPDDLASTPGGSAHPAVGAQRRPHARRSPGRAPTSTGDVHMQTSAPYMCLVVTFGKRHPASARAKS
jgi:hypothetical protein